MKNFYAEALQNLKKKSLYRSLISSDAVDATTIRRGKKNLISFCSNDYFGLSQNSSVKKAAIAAIKKYGVGAGASRYVTGNNSLYEKLEKQIARMKKTEAAIVFGSGYASAIGVIPALVAEGDLIVADRLIHSSLIDGSKLSGARLLRFLHNDVASARKILAENRTKFKKCLIVTETVFSMDGDVGEVGELLKLAEEFDAILISDAAHDLFLNVHSARGWTGSLHLQLGTFSKSVGTLGGYVAGDGILIDYLRNFAKSAIYSTALPPAILAASLTSLKIIEKKNLGAKALQNAEYFCELMGLPDSKLKFCQAGGDPRKAGRHSCDVKINFPKPQSAIVPIILGDNKKVLAIAKKVADQGMLISAIRPPTVEVGKARLRITFSAVHLRRQVERLVVILKEEIG